MGFKRFVAFCTAIMALAVSGQALADCKLAQVAELPVTMRGHQPLVTVKVNGKAARFLVDTGAVWNAMAPGAAANFGLSVGPAPFGMSLQGAGGSTMNISVGTARDVTFADVALHHVDFIITDKGFGAEAGVIGENFLRPFDVEYDLANGVIRLFKPEGCGAADLAYWVGPSQTFGVADMDRPDPGEPTIMANAQINGQRVRVALDTGAYNSTLSLRAAARAGVHPTDPGVTAAGYGVGVAQRSYMQSWIAPFSSFKFGGEEIVNFKLPIADTQLSVDMLLGADFFLAHRVFVSNSQRKIYFTYNGGAVFDQTMGPPGPASAAQAVETPSAAPPLAETMDAAAYSRHAAALSARQDYAGAIDDLTRAIALAPTEPRYRYERAMAHRANLQPPMALDDLNQALALKPNYIPALLARAQAYEVRKMPAEARADLDAADRAAVASPASRLAIATSYFRAGYEPEGIAELDQWIAAHPKDDALPQALGLRCDMHALRNEALEGAQADCNAALRLLPGDPVLLNSRGMARLRLGDLDGAITDFSASLKLQPRSTWSLYGRGLAELKKGMKAEGQADLAAARAILPPVDETAARRGLTP